MTGDEIIVLACGLAGAVFFAYGLAAWLQALGARRVRDAAQNEGGTPAAMRTK